jgi:hypothetical protein
MVLLPPSNEDSPDHFSLRNALSERDDMRFRDEHAP